MISRQLRVAVIGTRGQGERVAVPTILASKRAVLVGLLGSDLKRTREVAARLDITAYPSLSSLATGEVDAVWLTAPNHLEGSKYWCTGLHRRAPHGPDRSGASGRPEWAAIWAVRGPGTKGETSQHPLIAATDRPPATSAMWR